MNASILTEAVNARVARRATPKGTWITPHIIVVNVIFGHIYVVKKLVLSRHAVVANVFRIGVALGKATRVAGPKVTVAVLTNVRFKELIARSDLQFALKVGE